MEAPVYRVSHFSFALMLMVILRQEWLFCGDSGDEECGSILGFLYLEFQRGGSGGQMRQRACS